jgi:TetR/AcrR family transcriptional regulator, cholesterol catabolism regulator
MLLLAVRSRLSVARGPRREIGITVGATLAGMASSTRRGTADSAHRTRRRDELLHVAAAVFAERGYHGASMREIADRWGVQAAALYYYFPSKAKLLEGICEYGITQFLERLRAILAADSTVEAKLERAIRAHIEPLVEDRFYVQAFLYLRRELPRSARRPLDAQARAYEALWRDLVREGQRAGRVARGIDVELMVLAILGMCNSVARWSQSRTKLGVDPVARVFTELVSRGLFGTPRARRRRAH